MESNERIFGQPATRRTYSEQDLWEMKNLERFANFVHPAPLNEEVVWDHDRIIMSKTDPYGVIEYANQTFIEVSGYAEHELVGMPHSIVRHPDMPKVLFKVLWDNLKQGNVVKPIVKNLSKSGRYYWVIADFEIKRNDAGEITHYYSRRRSVPKEVVVHVEGLYAKLMQIEQSGGMQASENYLVGYLEDVGKTYNELIEHLMLTYSPQALIDNKEEAKEVKKGFFARFFGW